MPGRHPDDDLLADLAADVLPGHQARAVEAHVLSCDRCAGLLEDAERVRSLLLSGDPGPVPADVWHRIEAALAAEATAGTSSSRAPDHTRDTAAFQAFVDSGPTPATRSLDHVDPGHHPDPRDDADALDDADPLDDPARWSGRPVRGGSTRTGLSRRDARSGPRLRRGPMLLAAAAVVAVVALVGSVKLLGGNTSGEASLSAGTADNSQSANAGAGAAQAQAQTTIVRSGRDYRASTLAADASALLAVSTPGAHGPAAPEPTTGGGSAQGSASRGPSARAIPPGHSEAPGLAKVPAARVPADPAATDITNPTRLAGCLSALGVAPDRLVAVDLATYEGREAAILLVTSPQGSGHEVWAVDRTCGPGAEGALNYTRLSN